MPRPALRSLTPILTALGLLAWATTQSSYANELLAGYQTFAEFEQHLKKLAKHEACSLSTLGTTAEGRDIRLLTLGRGDADSKPALLLMGSVDAANLTGSELAIRLAQQLLEVNRQTKEQSPLQGITVYIVPRPSPDASQRVAAKVLHHNATNSRPTDADRDGLVDEDGPEDLNGDGIISQMRIGDPSGAWMPHPNDPRVLVKAEASKNEQGRYRVEVEGIDNDGDEQWNEDGPGGVDFNQNFTFDYDYFGGEAGPHQISEAETRAIADWAMSRRNIFAVYSFSPQHNLPKPWPEHKDEGGRIKTKVLKADAAYYTFISELYSKRFEGKKAPESASHAGAFAPWSYFHCGRWSLSAPGWVIPDADKPDADEAETDESEEPEAESPAEPQAEETGEAQDPDKPELDAHDKANEPQANDNKASNKEASDAEQDKRKSHELAALDWFERAGIRGFLPWQEFDHPDFPDQTVEIGGFIPRAQDHPPADKLDGIANQHCDFLLELLELRAKLDISSAKLTSLGGGIFRLEAKVTNLGFLPTTSAMGQLSRQLQRLQLHVELPEGGKLLTGNLREDLGVLAGNGGQSETNWLVQLLSDAGSVKLRAGEPSVGYCETTLEVASSVEAAQSKEASSRGSEEGTNDER